jgi:hypothetical protein
MPLGNTVKTDHQEMRIRQGEDGKSVHTSVPQMRKSCGTQHFQLPRRGLTLLRLL